MAPLVIIFAGVMVYTSSFSGVFVFDDYVWIVNNNDIKSLWTSFLGSSRPLVGFTFYLNYLVSGLKVADYHFFNLTIHLFAGLLLFGILRNTLRLVKFEVQNQANSTLFSLIVALIWIVHPLQVESVTYIVQRSESLMGMFYLLTLYCFIKGVTADVTAHHWFTGAIISCALGMTCKPVMVTAPLIVLFYDRTFISGSFVEALRKHRGVYIGLAATWLILIALLSVPNESSSSAGFGAITTSPVCYLMTQAGVILHYIRLAFWPVDLCLDYDWPPAAFSLKTLLQAVILGILVLFTLLFALKRNAIGFVGLSFFILLMPSSSIIPLSDCAAEHRMYLPLIPIVILFVMTGVWIIGKLCKISILPRVWAVIVIMLATALIIGLGVTTINRNRLFQSEELIWRQVVSLRPDNLRGYLGLGSCLLRDGRNKQAEAYFIRILEDERLTYKSSCSKYTTEFSMACNNLGVIRFREGKYSDAVKYFTRALEMGFSPDSQRNLELAQSRQKEEEKLFHKRTTP
ncbi:MAG: tetratricopeptide repeat protein [Kiritimatiellae bacterium]|nr:tetratricopeptide repeat protein [Kiritimatiellia bacterium]